MRLIGVGILLVASAALVFAQRNPTYGSLGGYGNVLYPGTGHAPAAALNLRNSFPVQLGATVQGNPYGYGYGYGRGRGYRHPGHGATTIVPYPVFIGGYYGADTTGGYAPDPYYASGPPPDQPPVMAPNGAPSVVINQNFIPDRANPVVQNYGEQGQPAQPDSGMRLYQGPMTNPYASQAQQPQQQAPAPATSATRPAPANDDQPTLYLLAFKDHNIVPALGYWMEGDMLHYVSVEHTMNQVSLNLIDRDLSQRLNDERGVEFKLPKGE